MEDTRKVKPWEELSEEERQKIRESWKVKLPEKFDVFCNGDWVHDYDINVPGNLYVKGELLDIGAEKYNIIHVDENFTCGSYVECASLHVGCDCFIDGDISCTSLYVGDNFRIHGDVTVWHSGDLFVGNNFIVCDGEVVMKPREYSFKSGNIAVGNSLSLKGCLDCYDIYICGNAEFFGEIDCRDMDVYGAFYCDGKLTNNSHTIRIGPAAFISLANL